MALWFQWLASVRFEHITLWRTSMVFECQWRLFYKTSLASHQTSFTRSYFAQTSLVQALCAKVGYTPNGWPFGGGFPQRIECIPGSNLLMTIVCYVMVKWRGRKPWLFVLCLSILISSVGSVVTTEQNRWSPWKSVAGAQQYGGWGPAAYHLQTLSCSHFVSFVEGTKC